MLAGDWDGNRILKACDLIRSGFAPTALVSGPPAYATNEADLAIDFAVKRGCPRDWFIPFPIGGTSTKAEAQELAAELRRRGVRRFLLVTSNYHTRRSANIWREAAQPASFVVVGASYKYFRPEDWWRDREGRKTVFFEWSKTVATWAGM